jgi:hypothetical protein
MLLLRFIVLWRSLLLLENILLLAPRTSSIYSFDGQVMDKLGSFSSFSFKRLSVLCHDSPVVASPPIKLPDFT